MSTASRLAKLAEGLDSNGVLSADKGGTGATSLAAVVTSATPAGVSDQANTSTGYFDLPAGTTAQRPGTANTGMVRYNSTLSIVETYNGTSWTGLGGGAATVSATAPANPTDGAFWLNNETGDLNVYAGGAWILVGGSSGGGASTPNAVSDQANTSTGYFDLPGGTTAQRPAIPQTGNIRYNSTTGFAEVYTSAGWGSFGAQPPSISSVLPITFSGEQGTVFTINGANFTADAQVKFIDNAGIEYAALVVAFVNTTQLTATTPQDFTVAQEPLDVKVLQASGNTTKTDCIDCGGTPTWTTAAGTLSSVFYPTDTTISTSVAATDPDSGATISYALTTGTLPSGMSLNTSTGAITGTVANPAASSVTTSFDITASDNAGNTSVRTFNIIRKWVDGSTQALASTSAAAIYSLGSSVQGSAANGKYWIKLPGNSTATQVYCNMTTGVDGGGWMLSFYKAAGSASYTYKQLWYSNSAWNNTTYTDDSTVYPVLPDQTSFGAKGFTKQMFNNQHPSWMTNKGNFQWYNLQTDVNWSLSGSITANNFTTSTSTAATTLIYNRTQAWYGGTATLTGDNWAWWADSGNGGLCGGANICGTQACPTTSSAEGCHVNGSYPLLIYVK